MRDHLKRRWLVACVVGELLGFIPPAVVGAVIFALDGSDELLVTGLVIAGALEGLILGGAQARVLRTALPTVSGWTAVTAVAAAVAWLAGMGGSALVQALGPAALVIAGPGWILGLLAMSVLQWWRLQYELAGTAIWIPVTSAAWLVGVSIPVVALSIVPNGWPLVAHVVVGVASAVAMGATVGAMTAEPLARFVSRARTAEEPGPTAAAFARERTLLID